MQEIVILDIDITTLLGSAMTNKEKTAMTLLISQIAVSVIVLLSSLYVILTTSYPDDHTKWAFAMVGLIIGYLLNKKI